MPELPFISIVIPVKNGEGKLEHCLASLRRQDYPSDRFEVLVADGLSTDRTAAIAKEFGAAVVINNRRTVAGGRNVGIMASRGSLIAFTDDDCILPRSWLRIGQEVLTQNGFHGVGGPTPLAKGAGPWPRAINEIFRLASMMNVSVQSDQVKQRRTIDCNDLPGGNALYVREALEAVFPIDEKLITAEDVDMHMRMSEYGFRLGMCPDFFSYHNKRDTVRGFFRQMKRFAIGRVQLWRKNHKGLKGFHWVAAMAGAAAVIGAAVLSAAAPFLVPLLALFGWLSATLIGLLAGQPMKTAILFGPALVVFLSGWSFGFFSEMFFPLKDSTGK